MEAMWTRYLRITREVGDLVGKRTIGKEGRVFADLSVGMWDIEKVDQSDRMVNMDLAGGALLDCE